MSRALRCPSSVHDPMSGSTFLSVFGRTNVVNVLQDEAVIGSAPESELICGLPPFGFVDSLNTIVPANEVVFCTAVASMTSVNWRVVPAAILPKSQVTDVVPRGRHDDAF